MRQDSRTYAEAKAAALAAAFAILVAMLFAAAPARAGDLPSYGDNDAGGFRNVLPPGQKGTDNAVDLVLFEADGTLPPHWDDQQPLYDGLIDASAAPGFGMSEVKDSFKDATFGVKTAQVEGTETPRAGVTIIRDSAYGVPHVYGVTRDDVMFGAGYVNAEDRLFLMDILRHTGRAELSSFIGGSPSNRAMDAAQWQFAPYTDEDLQAQVDAAPELYGNAGAKVIADIQSYTDGINAYITEALSDPTKLPAEYAALGKLPQPWEVTDSVAEASLIGGIFGKGGGRELDSALTLQSLQHKLGKHGGRGAWHDFRSKNDPEAPTTLSQRFPYETTSPFAKKGLAIPDPGTLTPAPVTPKSSSTSAPSSDSTAFGNVGADLMEALSGPGHASNWELVSGRESSTGHPVGVLGPQVGYYQPQILMEVDLHGPHVDARGATFPGVGLYVLLGHGRDYAWSATTATSDNVDTVGEVLCQDEYHYRYKGECLPMEELQRNNTWTPNGVDMTPPGSETLTAYRTVHGMVTARGEVKGKPVAYVIERSSYFHEADSALFFRYMNDPSFIDGPQSFLQAAKAMNFLFNWSYIDRNHIAYEQTGWMPQRAKGTSPDFPVLGTGKYDWKGYDPETHTADWLPDSKHPHAIDPPYLVSWNNKQAPGWAAADDQWAYGPMHRSQLIADRVRRGTAGDRKMSLPELVQAMDEPATEDLRAVKLLPIVLKAVGHPQDPDLAQALKTLRDWRKDGGHLRDLDADGSFEHTDAIQIMDSWWPLLAKAEFQPTLGDAAYDKVGGMLGVGDHTRGAPNAPDFFGGWWGYVSKDLRTLYGNTPKGAYSRVYCGKGSKAKCRQALRSSLGDALQVSATDLYGGGDCSGDPDPECYDRNRATHTSAISLPEMPFQNRPTFQQTVKVKKDFR